MNSLIQRARQLIFWLTFAALAAGFLRTPVVGRLVYPYPYREVIEKHASQYGVDPLLVAAVIRTESKFRPDAVSPKGALGLMQIMPSTAAWIAPNIGVAELTEEMILDPDMNVRLGAWYLSSLSQEFNGRLDVMVAAYNGGRGQVSRWLAEGVWSGEYENRSDIPFPETRLFVQKVRSAYNNYSRLYR